MSFLIYAQKSRTNPVYIDNKGTLRWTGNNKEASFFGVNYTVPFAYGYRSHKALGVDPEKAIDADVHHMARLGLNAFRVHVWDVDITDSSGNLLENEHLRLFDYLISKLKQKHIKILITPIAFWGNGYPERDVRTNGFSYVYGKGGSVVNEEAFRAQENYLQQFFNHVNPYTSLKYKDDPDVIAMEINNEPHHSGPKERTAEYINRMAAAVRSTGWTKPVFYNISESYRYADAIVKANVDGYSFQWYPTGLVANREQEGNFLPHVAAYNIPFDDTIPAFKKGALMVYEFDAGDVMQPIMYPAMARSYRTAGFQWATQFAYDPLYTAYGNTEYQTHYLNLIYTPAKAISLLIASKIFQQLPRGKAYGVFPADTLFDVFRISYKEQLSVMNSGKEYYHTGNTITKPKNFQQLKHIAGVGNSPLVKYEGTGAYFLDGLENGGWQLEIYPDAIALDDPFKRASPKKEVTSLVWNAHPMQINVPGLENGFRIIGLNKDNDTDAISNDNKAVVKPGIYLLLPATAKNKIDEKKVMDFYAPASGMIQPLVMHQPYSEISSLKPFSISATIIGSDTSDRVSLELRHTAGQWKTLGMERMGGYKYSAEVPSDYTVPGMINYRIMIRKKDGATYTFPGGFKGDPYAWDEWRNESWSSFIASGQSSMEIFHSTRDRNKVVLYNTDWRNNRVEYIAADDPGRLALKTTMTQPNPGQMMGWQFYIGERSQGRKSEMSSFTKILIKARATGSVKARLTLIDTDANAYGSPVALTAEWKTIEIPLSNFQKDSMLLLPRPYPGFQNLWFRSSYGKPLNIEDVEKLELRFSAVTTEPAGVEVQWVRLKK